MVLSLFFVSLRDGSFFRFYLLIVSSISFSFSFFLSFVFSFIGRLASLPSLVLPALCSSFLFLVLSLNPSVVLIALLLILRSFWMFLVLFNHFLL